MSRLRSVRMPNLMFDSPEGEARLKRMEERERVRRAALSLVERELEDRFDALMDEQILGVAAEGGEQAG